MAYGQGINYMQPLQIQAQNIVPQERHVERVHGEPGVDQYQMGPNSDVLLLDDTAAITWFVQEDAAGYKVKYPYDITPHKKEEEKKADDRDAKLTSIDERLRALEEALK